MEIKRSIVIKSEDDTIERAIPDFEERHLDSRSSNIEKLDGAPLSFFELVVGNVTCTDEPIFQVTLFEGKETNPMEYNGPKIISSKCINGYTCSLEDVIFEKSSRKVMMK